MKEKVVGIIGGMGPEATVDFMRRVIECNPASDDCDHLRMLVDNNPKVPSRIDALIHGHGESPGPHLAEMAKKLEAWGADFLAMPCNTAHYYYDEIGAAVSIPFLNMIDLTVGRILGEDPDLKAVGILASTAVLKTGLYDKGFHERGVKLLCPPEDSQARLLKAIHDIKAGDKGEAVKEEIAGTAAALVSAGAGAVLIACTELSIVGEDLDPGVKVYDSAQVLAEAVVKRARQ